MLFTDKKADFKKYESFSKTEFDCKCGCGKNNMKKKHMNMLSSARKQADFPFVIISGTRCKKHNKDVGGAEDSDHLTGHGTDIKCLNSRTRYKMINALLNAGFNRIGIADTFIHAGSDKKNPKNVIWTY